MKARRAWATVTMTSMLAAHLFASVSTLLVPLSLQSSTAEAASTSTTVLTGQNFGGDSDFTRIAIEEGLTLNRYNHFGNTINTAQKLCSLTEDYYTELGLDKPYPVYVGKNSNTFSNCGNDYNNIWNGGWISQRACNLNSYLSSVTCKSSSPVAACNDGVDNDNDGKTDYPADPGCSSAQDNSENNPSGTTECSDGVDNDNDGKTDALTTSTAGGGNFAIENGNPKYGKTWVASITCRRNNGSTNTIGGSPGMVLDEVSNAIQQNNLPFTKPTVPFVRTDGGSGHGNVWNDGTPHMPTLNAVCTILGYESYVSSTCLDTERSGLYPNGKCNFHTPSDNEHSRFSGTISLPACSDGQDNDNDGRTDMQDGGCDSRNDDSELEHDPDCDSPSDDSEFTPRCRDGKDNDNDGRTDYPSDPGCSNPDDNTERDPNGPECDNGIDDDNDGDTDYPDDSDCDSPTDDSEDSPECSDGVDNDGDGATDYPADFSCISPQDDDETNAKSACQDGIDNDGDGRTDFPQDPGCENKQDDSEKDPNGPECDNGIDDDNDGDIDYPADVDCDSPIDDSEDAPITECSDGIDNDSDGKTDFPDDRGCESAQDDEEAAVYLSIDKIGPSSITAGDVVTYTINIRNISNHTLTKVKTVDVLTDSASDYGFTFLPSQSSTSCNLDSIPSDPQRAKCGPITLGANQQRSFTIAFQTPANQNCNAQIENTGRTWALGADVARTKLVSTVSCVQAACNDGIDNDQDGLTDYPSDPGCLSPTDNSERDINGAQCDNGIDDSDPEDTIADYPADPGCTGPTDNDETDITACNDGIDNDQDGLTDYPADPGCLSPTDNSERDINGPQCDNGIDDSDPEDTIADYPADPGCTGPTDNDETDAGVSVCNDGIDNDQDGLTDYPADPGCLSPTDNSERDINGPQCDNGIDDSDPEDTIADYPADPGCTGPTDNDETDVSTADLSIVKSGAPTVIRENVLLYTLTATNNGPGTATNVSVTDAIPTGLIFNTTYSDSACILHGTSVVCNNVSTLTPGQSHTFGIAFNVPSTVACSSTITNQASVSGSSTDTNPANNQSNVVYTNVLCITQPECSDGIDNDSDGATDFPADFACDSPQDNDEGDVLAQCQDLQDNDIDGDIDFPADQECDSAQDDDESFGGGMVDMSVNKTGPSSISKGDTIIYDITVFNNGPDAGTYVSVVDHVPNGLIFDTTSSSQECYFNVPTNSVICDLQSAVPAGTSEFLHIAFFVPGSSLLCGDLVRNQVEVLTAEQDSNYGNNISQEVATYVGCPGFDVTKTVDKTQAQPGDTLEYEIVVKNNSTQFDAIEFTAYDQLPSGVDFVSCSDQCIYNSQSRKVAWFVPFLGAQYTTQFSLLTTVRGDAQGTLVNIAQVANRTASAITTIGGSSANADLEVVKQGPAVVDRGTTLYYNVTAHNNGPDTATNVTVADPVPAGLTFNQGASSTNCALIGVNVICDNMTLAQGLGETITIAFDVPSGIACQSTIVNQASVAGSSTDTNPSNNQSNTVTTIVACPAVFACNDGADNDGDGEIDYPNDPGCSSNTDDNENGAFACDNGIDDDADGLIDFQIDGSGDPECVAPEDQDEAPGGSSSSSSSSSTTSSSSTSSSSSSSTTSSSSSSSLQDVTITLSDSHDPVEPDDYFTYTVRITNPNNQTVNDLDVRLFLDRDAVFSSTSNGGIYSGGTVTWYNVSVSANDSITRSVYVRVDDDTDDGDMLLSVATTDNATDDETTQVETGSTSNGITLNITDERDPVSPGETFEYRIRVTNEDDNEQCFDVHAFLDDNTVFMSASDDGDEEDDDEVVWDNICIDGDDSDTLRLEVRVSSNAYDNGRLRLRVRADNEEDTEYTTVYEDIPPPVCVGPSCPPIPCVGPSCPGPSVGIVTVDKTADRNEVQPGSTLSYTLSIRNLSDGVAEGLIVEDRFTAGTLTVEDAAGGYPTGNGIRWDIPSMGPSETRVIHYRVRVDYSMRHGQIITNNVNVTGLGFDRTATDSTQVSVIEFLPQTGEQSITRAFDESGQFLKRITSGGTNGESSVPFVLWTTIITMGMGIGSIVGKQFMF